MESRIQYNQALKFFNRYKSTLSFIFILAVFSFMGHRFYQGWQSLPEGFAITADWSMLVFSFLLLITAFLLVASRWGLVLHVLGMQIPYRTSIRIWFLSQMGRYLPGGVWNYVGRLHLGRAEMSGGMVVLSTAIETLLQVLSEGLVFLISLPFWASYDFLPQGIRFLSIGGIAAGLVMLHPRVTRRMRGAWWMQRVMGNKAFSAPEAMQPSYGRLLSALLFYIATVIMAGTSFWFLQNGIYKISYSQFPYFIGSMALSTLIGFIFPLAPNGWGVREATMVLFLGQIMPSPVAIVVSVACRLWLIVAEWFWILILLCRRPRSAQ